MRVLALSGGKDSLACLFLLKDSIDVAIYVDTGFAFEETKRLIDLAANHVRVITIKSDRAGQNAACGIPADVVPVDWTAYGQMMAGPKPVMIQSYLQCCQDNLCAPLFEEAKRLGATEIVFGQRNEEGHKSPARNGDVTQGIARLHPIEEWTADQVLSFLSLHMEIPAHFAIKHSSLDCYDCPAYRIDSSDRIEWMRKERPIYFAAYKVRADAVDSAISAACPLR